MMQKLKNIRDTFSRPPQLWKTHGVIGVPYQLIQSAFLPGENVANDEYRTLWRRHLPAYHSGMFNWE
jgi:hypothetical protein